MAIFHLSIKIVSRSSGKGAVAAAAYRAGAKLEEKETGYTHDYTRKSGVIYSEIFLPTNAPQEYQNREILWNEVQKVEKKSDAQLAREIEVALPVELSREEQITLLQNYIAENFTSAGMCADMAIHEKHVDGKTVLHQNPHAHILLTTRGFKEDGSWAPKEKKTYALDENGERIPTIHEGYVARQMKRRGLVSERMELNREIKRLNQIISKLKDTVLGIGKRLMELKDNLMKVRMHYGERNIAKRTSNTGLTDKADAALRKQKQAEQDAAYARSHMKIKEVEVERKVLYEKCKNCKQSLLDKKITNYHKRKEYLENYLFLFMMLCTTTMILTSFQQEAFWKDTVDFFTTFLNGCGEVLEMIVDAECGLAQLLAGMIRQSIWSNVVYWIALILFLISTGILLFFICHMVWDKYRKKIRSGVNMWTVSAAILLLMVVVYLGDYIRMIVPINLFLLWLVGVGALLAAEIYVAECKEYHC